MAAQILSLHCVLKNKFGQVLSESFSRDVLTMDQSPQAPLRGLNQGLKDIKKGEHRKIFVPADQAYGFYDIKKVVKKSLSDFKMPPRLGDKLKINEGDQYSGPQFYAVTHVSADGVTLDGNHPLAGEDLIFEVVALDARTATQADIDLEEDNRFQFH